MFVKWVLLIRWEAHGLLPFAAVICRQIAAAGFWVPKIERNRLFDE